MDNDGTENVAMVDWIAEVPKKSGNQALKFLHSLNLVDDGWMISHHEEMLLIPLKTASDVEYPSIDTGLIPISFIRNSELRSPIIFSPKESHKVPLLRDAVALQIPSHLLELVPKSYDVIGSVAILEMNRYEQTELNPYMKIIASTMLETNHSLTTVIGKAGDIDGVFRTRKYEYLAGERTTETIHRENNCRFQLDVEQTFFTPRLVFERKRLAHFIHPLIEKGVTWDMFCGVGPFIIQIAKNNPTGTFLATDINSTAIDFARKNAELNHIRPKIDFKVQDLFDVNNAETFRPYYAKITRFIMNLPEKNINFLHILSKFIDPCGAIIHIYQFNEKENPCQQAEEIFRKKCQECDIIIREILLIRIVKPFSPSKDTTVIDAIIEKANTI